MTTSTFAASGGSINDSISAHTVGTSGQVSISVEGNLGGGKLRMVFRKNRTDYSPFNDRDSVFLGPGVSVLTAPAGLIVKPERVDGSGQPTMAATVEILDLS